MLDEEEFRGFLRREYGRESIFARQQDYLAEMATPRHLWFDPEQFRKTFPKAIAFEPEKNVEKFIREFILEESPLDVRDVKTAVGAYRETQARLAQQEDEAKLLRNVHDLHVAYKRAQREAAILQHMVDALEHARLSELVDRHENELANLRAKHAQDNEAFDIRVAEAQQWKTALEEFRLDADETELRQKRSEQETKRTERKGLLEAQASVRQRLRDLRHRWEQWLRRGGEIKLEGLADALTVEDSLLDELAAPNEATGLRALAQLAERFSELFAATGNLLVPHVARINTISSRLKQIAIDLERLDEKQTPGDFPLFQAIKARLVNSSTPPEQLCRLIEVRPDAEEWRAALELVLGRNRFAIVVGSGEDYRAALEVLRKRAPGDRSVDESLVHPREAAELRMDTRKNSLADKVEMAKGSEAIRSVAEQFTRHLLGRVVAAERVEDLDLSECGVTLDGIFKEVPTRRRLRQLPGFEFTLGTEGLKRLRAVLTREQQGLMAERENRQALINEVHAWLETGKQGGLSDPRLPDRSGELSRLPVLDQELAALKRRIVFLETPERSARLKRLDQLQADLGAANQAIGELRSTRQQFEIQQKRLQEALDRTREDLKKGELDRLASRTKLPEGILETELKKRLNAFQTEFKNWEDRRNAAENQASDARVAETNACNARNNERRALISATDAHGRPKHPQYRHDDFDSEEESNEHWQGRLRLLEEVQLEESRNLAAERRKDWERRLKDQVLNRLNENLQTAERAVRQLRGYLDVRVGSEKYRISQERDPAMRLLTPQGSLYGGADALIAIAGQIWWAWPLHCVAQVPLVSGVLRHTYAWVARRRNCLSGSCQIGVDSNGLGLKWIKWVPAVLLPIFAAALGRGLPGWVFMWVMAFTLFVAAKWITISGLFSTARINQFRLLEYLVFWPGMDPRPFYTGDTAPVPPKREWVVGGTKTLFGAALLWFGARWIPLSQPLLIGWAGMFGLVFLLHFGIFHLLSLYWRARGINARPIMRSPGTVASLAKFWGGNWNAAFSDLMQDHIFKPLARNIGASRALFAIFLISGILHELVISFPAHDGYGLATLYFAIQGFGVFFERS